MVIVESTVTSGSRPSSKTVARVYVGRHLKNLLDSLFLPTQGGGSRRTVMLYIWFFHLYFILAPFTWGWAITWLFLRNSVFKGLVTYKYVIILLKYDRNNVAYFWSSLNYILMLYPRTIYPHVIYHDKSCLLIFLPQLLKMLCSKHVFSNLLYFT